MAALTKKTATAIKKAPASTPIKPVMIDAEGQIVGRLATRIALALRGKNLAGYTPHHNRGPLVVVSNIRGLKFSGKKTTQKMYYHYSGYPGGLKKKRAGDVLIKNPGDVLRRAVWNMLPKNRLRAKMIKRLQITK